ncbi:sensor histidine kinase [Pedobacter jejuensis]|uniref:Signal transduction histidine kinase internal region domain-containing protein n=1 Tax=Pedobacter jejuensis TaxID=1268550 RepID=A0A3N0BS87_9SPHI|nr:histidine kinase [Pedobacter jejuensis]RNL51855.1 hypothetical protein D7004_13750 [Pedobacter jejuensis]
MKFKCIVFLLFMVLLRQTSFAQKTMLAWNYNMYNSALATNNIYKIICDNNGHLWMATDRGIVLYNFSSFTTYNQLIDNDIANLFYEQNTSKLFALTYNSKLLQVNTQTKNIVSIISKNKVLGAFMYAYRYKGSLFFISSNQKFRLEHNKLIELPADNTIYKQYLDSDKSASTIPFKKFYEEITWENILKSSIRFDIFKSRNFMRLTKYNTVSIDGKIYHKHNNKYYNIIYAEKFKLKENQFITDIEIIDSDLYIAIYGRNGGVFRCKNYFSEPEKAVFTRISDPGSCTSICKDKLNNLWYSLVGKGLFLINKPALNTQIIANKDITQSDNQFIAVNDSLALFREGALESARTLLFDYQIGNLSTFNNRDTRIDLKQRKIYASLTDQDRRPYKDISHNKKMRFIKDSIKYLDANYKDHKISTHTNRIYRKGDYFENIVTLYAEDDSIYLYDLKKNNIERKLHLDNVGAINSIYFYNRNKIFLCANNGVYATDINFRKPKKLSSKVFKKVLINHNAAFFISNEAIEYMNLNTGQIRQVFNVKTYSPIFSILDFDLSENKIHVLTNIGYVNLEQSIIQSSATQINFNLEEIKLKSSSIYQPKETININRLDANEIKFVVQFLNPENKFYKKSYAFIKQDEAENWKSFNEDDFILTNITPGNYILKIKVGFSSTSKDKILTYFIKIEPAFWQTDWFIITSIILTVASIVAITGLIIKHNAQRKLTSVILEKHILEIENRAFLNQLNPHFLFNALNTLQDYIIRKDTHNGIIYLQRVASLHRNILQFNTKNYINVAEEKAFLEKYLFVQQKRFSDKFTFTITISEHAEQMKIPPMLLQPIVENAIEHGFSNTEPDKKININFEKIQGYLQISIVDNGTGTLEKISSLIEGHALYIISERLNFINLKNNTRNNSMDFKANKPKGLIVNLTIDL